MSTDLYDSHNQQEAPPRATYAPVAMAMGITMAVWGILTHWLMSLSGICLFSWALWTWMSEICEQWGRQDEN
ncbi:hypothetical protein [Calycomorphotria hydatis]|uniref:Uncharacterized protein n=1 Tax=Calycomorphotria hydatis TaxID=2528027 RepID=A0A517T981_9PLAN|nr:hypothetical protein [Calycomorphotria hydatis]QDT64944.1 hypothetical protein V22_21890 [Calycomorphotria hydatis]